MIKPGFLLPCHMNEGQKWEVVVYLNWDILISDPNLHPKVVDLLLSRRFMQSIVCSTHNRYTAFCYFKGQGTRL